MLDPSVTGFRRRAASGLLLSALAATCLTAGCALVDPFAGRAKEYNAQTQDARTASVLLNIMRAAYGEPLQFTDVSTVSGQGAFLAGLGAAVPVGIRVAPAIPSLTLSPTLQASGNTTVNVANLNTQEFYYGLQTPLPIKQIASYLSADYPASVLLPLTIASLHFDSNASKTILRNSAATKAAFFAFSSAMNELIKHGLSTEVTGGSSSVGPVLTATAASDPRLLAALISTTASDPPSLKPVQGGAYQLQKSSKDARFCFDRLRTREDPRYPGVDFSTVSAAEPKDGFPIVIAKAYGQPIPEMTLKVDAAHTCGSKAQLASATSESAKALGQNFSIEPRSLQGIFFYLGQMVRIELGLTSQRQSPLAIPTGMDKTSTFSLFHIRKGPYPDSYASVEFRGETYSIASDPSGERDGSTRVVQLMTDLLALQSSAKNLPAPNLISVLSP